MQKFEYRNPRIYTDFPITVALGENVIGGRCTDISVEGMGASLDRSIPIGTTVVLTLNSPTRAIELQARVSYSGQTRIGVIFALSCEEERNSLRNFLETVPNLIQPKLS